jgi:hypothetical protein
MAMTPSRLPLARPLAPGAVALAAAGALALALAAAGALAFATAASAQEPTVATLDRPTAIAAYNGRLLWSVRERASGRWSLVTRAGGVIEPVPVAPRGVPFDADLGPGPDGRAVAVYSRCAQDPPAGSGFGGPLYHRGRGCDVYLYDFAAGAERRLAGASAPRATEFWPTIWRGTIAFGRAYDNKRNYPYLYSRPLEGDVRSTRQPGGARKACVRNRNTGRRVCSNDALSRPQALDLYGRRLAFAWTFLGFAEGLDSEIRLNTIGGGHTRVARQGGGGLTQVALGWPAFDSGRLYWVQTCFGDPGGCPGRYGLGRLRISTGERDRAASIARSTLAHDRDAGVSYVLDDMQPGTDCLGDPEVSNGTCLLRGFRPAFG